MADEPVDQVAIALRFYSLILPEQGHRVAEHKRASAQGMRRDFAASNEALFEVALQRDREGSDAYHGCAAYREALNNPKGTPEKDRRYGRTKRNVLGAQALWLDGDLHDPRSHPEIPYRTTDELLHALGKFCIVAGLPRPIIVLSGSGGAHIYWPSAQMLDRATWERYARGLKQLCIKHGFVVDHVRTTDIASILRVPFTHNRKGGKVRPVEIDIGGLKQVERYPLERFEQLLEADVAPVSGQKPLAPIPGGDPSSPIWKRPSRGVSAAVIANVYPPSSFALIAERCGQVREFREKKGCIPEPQWKNNLWLAAFCEDGHARAHEYSSGYANYTFQETQAALDRARQFGPTTCRKFHEVEPKICEACPHWIVKNFKPPIVLGRQEDTPPEAANAAAKEHAHQGSVDLSAFDWELTQHGALKPKSYRNAYKGLLMLGLRFRHDVFHDKKFVDGGGDIVENLGPELSDAMCRALRDELIRRLVVDPGIENVQQAAERLCEANRFDPVVDYLNRLEWDGQPRLDRWLITYLGVEDTPLNRAIGRCVLIAAVRRARHPGTKFDCITVFEGPEGGGKSSVIEILAGKENFSDQTILGQTDRECQEKLKGVWFYEIADLTGMKRAEVEQVKAFASRIEDRARAAYGRFLTKQPRRCVLFATTNDDTYLKSQTGNRRFLPVRVGEIDLDALRRDRDQLMAEAAHREAKGESIGLPKELWAVAGAEQDKRLLADPWDDILADKHGQVIDGEERVSSWALMRIHLEIGYDRMTDWQAKRLARVMRRLGWDGPKVIWIDGRSQKGYTRPATGQRSK